MQSKNFIINISLGNRKLSIDRTDQSNLILSEITPVAILVNTRKGCMINVLFLRPDDTDTLCMHANSCLLNKASPTKLFVRTTIVQTGFSILNHLTYSFQNSDYTHIKFILIYEAPHLSKYIFVRIHSFALLNCKIQPQVNSNLRIIERS